MPSEDAGLMSIKCIHELKRWTVGADAAGYENRIEAAVVHNLGMPRVLSLGLPTNLHWGRQSDRDPCGTDVGRLYQDIQRHEGYQSVCEKSVVICITSVPSTCSKYSRFVTNTKKEHGQRQLATGYHNSIPIRRPPLHFIGSVSHLHPQPKTTSSPAAPPAPTAHPTQPDQH